MPGHDLNESLFSTYDFPKFRKKSWVEIEKKSLIEAVTGTLKEFLSKIMIIKKV